MLRVTQPVMSGEIGTQESAQIASKAIQSFSVRPEIQDTVFDMDIIRLTELQRGVDDVMRVFNHTLVRNFDRLLGFLREGDELLTGADSKVVINEGGEPGGLDIKKTLGDYIVVDEPRANQCGIAPGDLAVLKTSEFLSQAEYSALRRYA